MSFTEILIAAGLLCFPLIVAGLAISIAMRVYKVILRAVRDTDDQ